MDLPIKLMIVMVILTVSVPIISNALDKNEESMACSEMTQEMTRISDAISVVHYSGSGSSRTVDVNIPAGCEISIGGNGSDAYSARLYRGGEMISEYYLERPIVMICDETVLTGVMTLMVTSTYYGDVPGIEVSAV